MWDDLREAPTGSDAGLLRRRRFARISLSTALCDRLGVPFALSDHHARGGAGAVELAQTVMAAASAGAPRFEPLYSRESDIPTKIRSIAQKMYGADDVVFTKNAAREIRLAERLGYAHLPVCIAKAPSSLSDDPKLRGRPRDFEITVRGVTINAGAGFLVVLTGDIVRMPGLPRKPLAHRIELSHEGEILGLE